MPFIRVTDAQQKQVVDVNIAHIVAFTPAAGRDPQGSFITLNNGVIYHVEDTPRSLRGYIKKAEGTLPLPEPKDELSLESSVDLQDLLYAHKGK